MKSKKLVALITSATLVAGVMLPSVTSFADNVTPKTEHKVESSATTTHINKQQKEVQQKQQREQFNNFMAKAQDSGMVQKIEINTGKVIKTTKAEKEKAVETFKAESAHRVQPQSFAVTFNGYSHSTCYNGDNIHQLKDQNSFASKTNENLYNSMLNANNRWNAEQEAINLHDGNGADDCAYFVSSALRNIGVSIPTSTANCWTLQDNLSNLGWNQHYNLGGMQPGDVAFAGQDGDAHTYIFMGWANDAHTVAWVADSQYGWFGTNMHARGTDSGLDISPTVFYFTAPGSPVTTNANPTANANPDYKSYNVGIVNASTLNVRSQPNTNCSVIGTLSDGQVIQILAKTGDWDTINYNGQTAYVYAPFVDGNGPVHPNNITITNPTPPEYHSAQYNKIGTGTINQYTDAMSQSTWYSNCITTMNKGTSVAITGYKDGWYRVNYQDGSVWVPASRINTDLNGTQYKAIAQGITNFAGGTDVQSQATWYSSTLGYVPNGTNLTITGESNGWYRVNYANTTGWIPVNRVDNPSSYKVTPMNKTGYIEFNCGYTYTKDIPSWYGYKTYSLNNGTAVKVVGECDGWYKIEVNGQTQWVVASRVQFAPTAKVIGTGTVSFPAVGYTDVTSESTWYSSVAGTVKDGTQVKIIGQKGDWYNIIMPNNVSTAWVPKARVVTTINQNYIGIGEVNQYTDLMSSNTWYSNVLGTVPSLTPVNIISEVNGWYQVAYNGGTAWIPCSRITTNINKNKPVIRKGIVEFNDLSYTDIMTGSTWYSQVAGTLNNGTTVDIVGQENGWYEINYGNTTAWILKSRVSQGNILSVQFNLGYSDVMSNATWYSNCLTTLNNGTEVSVINNKDGWSQITYGNNQTGWIPSNRLH